MTALKIVGKPTRSARDGIEPFVAALYATPGRRLVGVIELEHIERTEPAPGADREPAVTVRMSALEVAGPEAEDHLREAQRALYLQRTARGTLDEHGDIELTQTTLERCAGQLHATEVARLRAAVQLGRTQIRRVLGITEVTVTEMRHELDRLADLLDSTLRVTDPHRTDDTDED
ncbi:MAG TPA: hypothetical protein VGD67_26835 [Pseudonocardiaceae bacterium]